MVFSLLYPCSNCATYLKDIQKAVNSKYGETPFTVVWKTPGSESDMRDSQKIMEESPAIDIKRYPDKGLP